MDTFESPFQADDDDVFLGYKTGINGIADPTNPLTTHPPSPIIPDSLSCYSRDSCHSSNLRTMEEPLGSNVQPIELEGSRSKYKSPRFGFSDAKIDFAKEAASKWCLSCPSPTRMIDDISASGKCNASFQSETGCVKSTNRSWNLIPWDQISKPRAR